jgi:SAM-dependent methyltransferase
MIAEGIELETTPCPLCASHGHRVAFQFSPFRVARCTACAFHYLSPRPTESAMLRLYADDAYFEGGEGGYDSYARQEQALRATSRRLLANLHRRGLRGADLLDVGCGYGYLLDEARPYFSFRVGTDFSARATERAALLADEVYVGGCEAIPPERRFDGVIATQVIEHVYHPEAFVRALTARLRPGGWVLIATPDMASFWRKGMRRRWPSFKLPEHVTFFDRRSLARVMERAGLGGLQVVPYPHAFPVPLIAAKLGLRVPGFLDRVSLWIPGTTIAMAGRVADE